MPVIGLFVGGAVLVTSLKFFKWVMLAAVCLK